ncbi:MAG: citrate/2-methylcitrate synthase, partial [bacterium]
IVYKAMKIDHEFFTPIFAVARVAGWTARILEYLKRNRIFRPRSIYVGPFNLEYIPIDKRRDSQ